MNMKKLIRKVGRSASTTTFNPPKEIVDHMRKSKRAVQHNRNAGKYRVGNLVGSMGGDGKVVIENMSSDEDSEHESDEEEV